MADIINEFVIEPAADGDGFWLVAIGEYGRSSVLAGSPLYAKIYWDQTEEDVREWAEAEGFEVAGTREYPQLKPDWGMSDLPPSWFDPGYAGERWEEDY